MKGTWTWNVGLEEAQQGMAAKQQQAKRKVRFLVDHGAKDDRDDDVGPIFYSIKQDREEA